MAIVVSHIADDFDTLAARALRQAPLADVIELRLDRIGDPGVDVLRSFLAKVPKPVIVSCPGSEAYGHFTGSLEERLDLLHHAAEAGANFVDIDWTLSLVLGEVAGKCHRIVSRHDVERTPEDLKTFVEEVREVLYEGDIVKIATRARSTEDGLRMLRFLRATGGGLIAFCSGKEGSFTRVLAPIFGSPFTYAAPAIVPGMPPAPPTAPGQIRVNDLLATFPPGGVNPETAVFAVVGNPVSGSWSPRVHGMAFKAGRLDAVYIALEPAELAGLLELADDENFRGFSITAPFKEEACRLAHYRDQAAESSGAVNTLIRDGARWRGANTDVPAVRETLEAAFRLYSRESGRPVALAVAKTLVVGAGGAARAAVLAVRSAGGEVAVAGRTPERANGLASALGCRSLSWADIPQYPYDVLIHATPAGSTAQPGELPLPEEWIRPGTLVLDAVYRPLRTPLLEAARRRGCVAVPGGEWFVRQAREQYRLFTRADPDDEVLRAAFEQALREDDAVRGQSG